MPKFVRLPWPPASLVLALGLPPAACDGARPLSTDDAAVQAVGDCQSDSYAGRAIGRARADASAAATQWGCGVFRGSALGLAYAGNLGGSDGEQTLALVGKTALQQAGDDGTGTALAWGTVGRKVRGTAFRYDGWSATLVHTAALSAGWTGHVNLGATYQRASHALTARWSVAAEHALPGRLRVGVEAFADDRDRAPWIQAGASGDLPFHGVSINASWGTQLSPTRNRLATLGTTVDF